MTKSKNTKRALLASVLSVVLCFAMLIGSTFAWFTDSVTSGKNVIQSGNLGIEAFYQDTTTEAGTDYTISDFDRTADGKVTFSGTEIDINANNAIITEDLWEPGAVGAKLVTVKNTGNLAAKIKLNFNVQDGGLQNALWYDFVMVKNGQAVGSFQKREMSTLNTYASALELPLMPQGTDGDCLSFILLYGMKEEAGNEYQGKTFTANVTILATQYTYETDSFDDQYDVGAVYPWDGETVEEVVAVNDTYEIGEPEQLAWVVRQINDGDMSFAGKTIKLTRDVDLNDMPWSSINAANSSLKDAVIDGDGHSILNMWISDYTYSTSGGARLYGAGFIGNINTGITIRNLSFENVSVAGANGDANIVGTVMGYARGNTVLENVHVKNGEVEAAGKSGGLIGMADSDANVTLTNCSVEGTKVYGWYNCGGLIGLVNATANVSIDDACATNDVSWVRTGGNAYIDVDTTITFNGADTPLKGTYWKYLYGDTTWLYAAWGDYYTDYYASDTSLQIDGQKYAIADGFCH